MSNITTRSFLALIGSTAVSSILPSCSENSASQQINVVEEQIVRVDQLLNHPTGNPNGYNTEIRECCLEATLPNGRKCILVFGEEGPQTFPSPGSFIKVKYENKKGSKASWEVVAYKDVTEEEFKADSKSSKVNEWVR